MLIAVASLMPLASFGRASYSLDETGIVKCVFKTGGAVGALMHIADKPRVDLSYVDRRTHEPAGDRGLLGSHECDV